MPLPDSLPGVFKQARECAGLSAAEVAERAGVSPECVHDLESYDDELIAIYSAAELQRFAAIFNVTPRDLLGIRGSLEPISCAELAAAIRQHCLNHGMAPETFGDAAGWEISKAVEIPQLFLTDYPIDGIKDLCDELAIDWRRFFSGLHAAA